MYNRKETVFQGFKFQGLGNSISRLQVFQVHGKFGLFVINYDIMTDYILKKCGKIAKKQKFWSF